jgi:hypothetical protein
MNYKEFAQKIKAKYPDYNDMDDQELAQKMVAKFPEYNDVTFEEAAASPAPEPAQSAVSGEQKQAGGLFASAFPKTFEAQMEDKPYLQQVGSAIGDVFSLPARAVTSAATFAGAKAGGASNQQASEMYQEDLAKRKSDMGGVSGFIEDVVEDPALIPSLAVGGPALGAGKSLVANAGKAALFGLAEGATSAAVHQAERFGETGKVNLGEAAFETGLSGVMGGGMHVGGKAISKLWKGTQTAKTIVSKFTQIPEEALERASNPAELKAIAKAMIDTDGNLGALGDDVVDMITKVKTKASDEIEGSVMNARPGATQFDFDQTRAYDSGRSISDAATNAKKATGQRFGEQQDEILSKSGAATRKVDSKPSIDFPYNSINAAEEKIDNLLYEIGYNPQKGYMGTKEAIGNKAVSKKAVDEVLSVKEMAAKATNTAELLNTRRQFQNKINFGGENNGPLFSSSSDDDILMKRVYGDLNEVIAKQLESHGKSKGLSTNLSDLWKSANKAESEAMKTLSNVQDGVGIGKANVEDFISRIQKTGIDDIKTLKKLASNDDLIKPVWEEIQKGYFDNMIRSSLDETGRLNVRAFVKNWNKADEFRNVMFDKKTNRHVQNAIESFRSKYGGTNVSDIGQRVAGKNTDPVLATKKLENISSKDNRAALKELEFLESILGVKGKGRPSLLAKDVYTGKQLGMTKKGELPKLTGITTGASVRGWLAGSSTGGAIGGLIGGPVGAAIGTPIGGATGALLQSPSGAVAMYSALNTVEKFVNSKAGKVVSGVADAAGKAYSKPVRQTVRSTLFQEDEED